MRLRTGNMRHETMAFCVFAMSAFFLKPLFRRWFLDYLQQPIWYTQTHRERIQQNRKPHDRRFRCPTWL